MTRATEPVQDEGPTSYRNWRAQIEGAPLLGIAEVPIYSDAHVTGDVTDGLGPYGLLNAIPHDTLDPAVVLTMGTYLDPNKFPSMTKTHTAGFTGAWLGDEIAALASLAFGARFMAGNPTRHLQDAAKNRWIIMGDRDRPAFFPMRANRSRVLPRVVQTLLLSKELLATFPTLAPDAATVLVRAARSYRDALWIAESEPELSWLMLVSALEVAAVHQHIEQTSPIEILRASKPALVARLEAMAPDAAQEVADALARELRATARFLDFMERFRPPPPERRPPPGFRLDWSPENLKRWMKKIYEYRSLALHEGIPFPPPMCQGPMFGDPNWEVPSETVPGLASSSTGGVWTRADTPFPLHMFEYITRSALLGWWRSLGSNEISARRDVGASV